jgi:hypothetical protein
MPNLPYVSDPEAIPRVLRLVRNTTMPGHVTPQHLRSNGFNAADGSRLVTFLRAINFIDQKSQPTKQWRQYRSGSTPTKVLGIAIRDAYAPLFEAFIEPARRSDDEIAVAVRQFTRFSETHVEQTVSSFRSLCAAAGYENAVISAEGPPIPARRSRATVLREAAGLSVMSSAEFETAHRALDQKLFRPAHVAAWNGFVALALMRMAADDFVALRRARPKWSVTSAEDLAMRIPGRALIDLLVELGFLEKEQEFALADLQQRRNECAHPTSFEPTAAQTAAYFDEILARGWALAQRRIS